MPTASLQALLAKSIDYAGMFPPCSLALEPALQSHAKYARSPEAWMLNTFILPVEQFDSTKQLLSQFDPLHPLRVAALGPKTADADAFLDALEEADAAIRSFSRYDVDLLSISHLEMFLPHDVDLALLEDENAVSFSLGEDCFAWREWKIDTERLQYRRRFVVSFGSCSFDEPREDLRALGLL